jgi:hypothetical protein
MPPLDAPPSALQAPAPVAWRRAGRALVMAVVVGALGLVGYDAWL